MASMLTFLLIFTLITCHTVVLAQWDTAIPRPGVVDAGPSEFQCYTMNNVPCWWDSTMHRCYCSTDALFWTEMIGGLYFLSD